MSAINPLLSNAEEISLAFTMDLNTWVNDENIDVKTVAARTKAAKIISKTFENKYSYLDITWQEHLDNLPPLVGRMTFLKKINLNHSKIKFLPKEIGLLHDLQYINLKHTDIKVLPKEFWNLSNLRVLLLNGTYQTSLPQEIKKLKSLRVLNLNSGLITSLPSSLGTLPNLRSIHFGNSFIKKSEVKSILQKCSNEHDKQAERRFESLMQLRESLDLDSDKTQIDLLDNLYSWVNNSSIDEHQQLVRKKVAWKIYRTFINEKTTLKLFNFSITELPSCIGMLTKLQVIKINRSKLKSLPKKIGQLVSLRDLYINDSELEMLPSSIRNLKNLRSLALDKNKLKSIPVEIGELCDLEFLSLSKNCLETVPKEVWNLTKLMSLYLDQNKLNFLPEIEDSKERALSRLVLCVNPIEKLPVSLKKLPKLHELNVDRTKVSDEIWSDIMVKPEKMSELQIKVANMILQKRKS